MKLWWYEKGYSARREGGRKEGGREGRRREREGETTSTSCGFSTGPASNLYYSTPFTVH